MTQRDSSSFARAVSQAQTIPTCENEAKILLLVPVLIIIHIITKYIIIIY